MDSPVLISIKQTAAMTSLSRGAINIMRRQGTFPAAVNLTGAKRVAFVRSEIEAWIAQRIASREAA